MSINWETQFLIPGDWTTENDLIQCVILEFFVKRRGFGFFSRPTVLTKLID